MYPPHTSAETLVASSETIIATLDGISVDDFLACYDTCFPQVYNYLCYRCGDTVIADDLTSAVFERALQRLGDYRLERGSVSAWLLAIARNLANNHYRFERRRQCIPLEIWSEQPDQGESPEESILQQETRQALLAALQKLDGRERDLLGLKFGGHLTNRRIAEMVDLSEANVGVIVHRALNKLRALLKS